MPICIMQHVGIGIPCQAEALQGHGSIKHPSCRQLLVSEGSVFAVSGFEHSLWKRYCLASFCGSPHLLPFLNELKRASRRCSEFHVHQSVWQGRPILGIIFFESCFGVSPLVHLNEAGEHEQLLPSFCFLQLQKCRPQSEPQKRKISEGLRKLRFYGRCMCFNPTCLGPASRHSISMPRCLGKQHQL